MFARGAGEGVSLGEGRRCFAGRTGKGLVGSAEGEVVGGPLLACVFGKNVSCSADMWQVLRRAGARIRSMRSIHTKYYLSASFGMRTISIGHLAGGRGVLSPSFCL